MVALLGAADVLFRPSLITACGAVLTGCQCLLSPWAVLVIRFEGEACMPWVRDYVRSDGTPVRGHSRWAPGARREMTVLALFALAVMALGNGSGNVSAGRGGAAPRSQSTVEYPIRFDDAPPSRIQQPRPTVSYPVRFPETEGNR